MFCRGRKVGIHVLQQSVIMSTYLPSIKKTSNLDVLHPLSYRVHRTNSLNSMNTYPKKTKIAKKYLETYLDT